MAPVAAGRRRRLVCWLVRCIDELSDGLTDYPRDRSVSRQRYLVESPIVLLFEAHGQPRCFARTLVHATLHAFRHDLTLGASEFNDVMKFSPTVSDECWGARQESSKQKVRDGVGGGRAACPNRGLGLRQSSSALIRTLRVDFSGWPLAPAMLAAFEGLVEMAKTDPG
jgi:hypothetical protein